MGDNRVKIRGFSKEPKFNVGQIVHVDLKDVPEKDRLDSIGVIIGVSVRFPMTKKLRHISYRVRFPSNYVKPESRFTSSGIPIIDANAEDMRLAKIP